MTTLHKALSVHHSMSSSDMMNDEDIEGSSDCMVRACVGLHRSRPYRAVKRSYPTAQDTGYHLFFELRSKSTGKGLEMSPINAFLSCDQQHECVGWVHSVARSLEEGGGALVRWFCKPGQPHPASLNSELGRKWAHYKVSSFQRQRSSIETFL